MTTAITPLAQAIPCAAQRQRGVTLLELMVGIVIGLMVVAVAMSGLMISRSVTGTVSDASTIQQQAAYAMRVIGAAARQGGSLHLDTNQFPNGGNTISDEIATPSVVVLLSDTPKPIPALAQIADSTVGSQYVGNKETNVFVSDESRNCKGDTISGVALVQNFFELNGSQLRCANATNDAAPQPIIQKVADFQVRYLVQDNSNMGFPTLRMRKAADVDAADWGKVQAIEVCLVLYGTETVDMPAGSTYKSCTLDAQGKPVEIDMTTLTGERARRLHLVFRNTFQIRSQGLAPKA